jgi:hypothetical protein
MPGISGSEPVNATHNANFQKPERISNSGMPKSICRFRQAVDESGALLGPKVFIVNTVLDPINTVTIVAGDPIAAHQVGAEIYAAMAGVRLDRPADIVIASARPLDIDLRVSLKACFNASASLKPEGLFIMVSKAPEGLGDLRLPNNLPGGAAGAIKLISHKGLEALGPKFSASPDQAAGMVSVLKILKLAKRWLFLTTDLTGVEPLRALGIEFFTDKNELMKRALETMPKGEVISLPLAGATYIAWD